MTTTTDPARLRSDYAQILDSRRQGLHDSLQGILAGTSAFVWEVGSGHGHFLTAYAAAHPEKLCIGIDLVGERIERATRKRDRAKLPNLHFIRAEARLFLQTVPATTRISRLFLLFPDPWPKARHHKHRVLQPEFLTEVAGRATTDCQLCFRTDFKPYFDETRAMIDASAQWARVETPWPFEFETVFQHRAERFDSLVAQLRPRTP